MALIPFNPNHSIEYSLKSDTGEVRSIFHLGTFDTLLRAHLEKKMAKMVAPDGTVDPAQATDLWIEIVRFGLKGWENFPAQYQTLEVSLPGVGKRAVLTDESIGALNLTWIIRELGPEIARINFPTKEESKNS